VIVLDASAVLELLLQGPGANAVQRAIASDAESLHAPHLLDLEVVQVLRRYHAKGLMDSARATLALDDLRALGITRYAHQPMIGRIWQLRANATAYDAAYLALAEGLAAPLLTFDERLANAPGHRARVKLLA
jgi:predicted nucleic acid-binding protein